MVRSMMSYSSLSDSFWGYALETAAYILNQVPSKAVPGTPYDRWSGRKSVLNHFRIWGCPAHVLVQKTSKLASRSELCLFVGYPKGTKGYVFYSPSDNKTFVSTNAKFLEEDFMKDAKPRSRLVLEELSEEGSSTSQREIVSQPIIRELQTEAEPTMPRHSGRVVREPERYGMYNAFRHTYTAVIDEFDDDPASYSKVMASSEANL